MNPDNNNENHRFEDFFIPADEEHVRREKARARELRPSSAVAVPPAATWYPAAKTATTRKNTSSPSNGRNIWILWPGAAANAET